MAVALTDVLWRWPQDARPAHGLRRQAGSHCNALGLPGRQAEPARSLSWRAVARGQPLGGLLGRR
jgi:hypothetical protein